MENDPFIAMNIKFIYLFSYIIKMFYSDLIY